MKKVIISISALLFLLSLRAFSLFAAEPLFDNLEKRLVKDGVDTALVRTIYQHPAVKLEPVLMASSFKRSEKTLDYSQYLTESTVLKARNYLNEHQEPLRKAYEQFGVPPQIIVAILTVETWLGTYTGKYLIINILSTMAVGEDHQVQEKIFSFLEPEIQKDDFQKKVKPILKQRAERGYRELKLFLEYVGKNNLDPFSIKGSIEGAIGIPQFMPSNISRYGYDGDNDNQIDLFNHADAIASIAAFLYAHNWKQARDVDEKKQILFQYNHSSCYVDTVYALAERLEPSSPLFYSDSGAEKKE